MRKILDDGGLTDALIFASGGLDEDRIARMVGEGAPIDGFGVGSSLVTSTDAPTLDTAYKLQEYAGLARRKQSEGKATWPGRKQVWRRYGDDGRMVGDLLTLDSEPGPDGAEALVRPVIENGRRIEGRPGLEDAPRPGGRPAEAAAGAARPAGHRALSGRDRRTAGGSRAGGSTAASRPAGRARRARGRPMRLTFLGTRAYVAAKNRRHRRFAAALVEAGGHRLMIDCGVGWGRRLPALAPEAIVLTHAHPDHAFGLGEGGAPPPAWATEATFAVLEENRISVERAGVLAPGRPVGVAGRHRCRLPGRPFGARPGRRLAV